MKKYHAQRIISIICFFSTVLFSFSFVAPIRSSALQTGIEVELITPITAEGTESELTPGTEAYNTIISRLLSITQGAYDAFIMDNPLHEMWIDITKSGPNFSYLISYRGNKYLYKVSKLSTNLTSRAEYVDPYAMTELVKERINSFTPSGDSLYDKVSSIHDFVCSGTVYDATGKYAHSAYGALVNGKSVCEGYAEAFKLICDANGIECILVKGMANGTGTPEAHMWNYVRMDDGKWYALDSTWDDGNTIENRYLLVGGKTEVNGSVTFDENHFPDGDISNTDIKIFSYPTLEDNSYLHNNPSARASEDLSGGKATTYYYDQLDPEQQNYYTALKNAAPPRGTGIPPEDTTTKPTVTTPEETTTKPTVTTPEETTTKPTVTTPEETTTKPTVTTPEDTTTKPTVTTPEDTTTKPTVTTPEDTATEIPPEESSSEDTSEGTEDTADTSRTEQSADGSEQSADIGTQDSESRADESSDEASGAITTENNGSTGSSSNARGILRVVIIIAAILSLFGIIAIIIVKSTGH